MTLEQSCSSRWAQAHCAHLCCVDSRRRDIVVYNEFSRGQAFQPSELKTGQISVSDGGIGLDATVAMDDKDRYKRAVYPTADLDLSKWFTDAECDDLRSRQDSYFHYLAKTGYA